MTDINARDLIDAVNQRLDDMQANTHRRLDEIGGIIREHARWTEQAHHELSEQLAGLGHAIQETRELLLGHTALPVHPGFLHRLEQDEEAIMALETEMVVIKLAEERRDSREQERVRLMRVMVVILGGIFSVVGAILLAVVSSAQIDVLDLIKLIARQVE